MPPLNNRIHACIQRVMLSFDDFSIKRRYKEKTVRIIKISLENGAICAGGNRTQDAPQRRSAGPGAETQTRLLYPDAVLVPSAQGKLYLPNCSLKYS